MEEMHLQENTLFNINLGVKVTPNVAQYPLHYVTYVLTNIHIVHQCALLSLNLNLESKI